MIRIGHGFDVHKFGNNGPVMIAGVAVPYEQGFIAHSDGDVALHAVCDALLGALALGDIGHHFPDNSAEFENIDSRILLRDVYRKVKSLGYRIGNLDVTVIAQAPHLAAYILPMREVLAEDLGAEFNQISVKATTTEKLGFTGRKEGVACEAVVLLMKNNNEN